MSLVSLINLGGILNLHVKPKKQNQPQKASSYPCEILQKDVDFNFDENNNPTKPKCYHFNLSNGKCDHEVTSKKGREEKSRLKRLKKKHNEYCPLYLWGRKTEKKNKIFLAILLIVAIIIVISSFILLSKKNTIKNKNQQNQTIQSPAENIEFYSYLRQHIIQKFNVDQSLSVLYDFFPDSSNNALQVLNLNEDGVIVKNIETDLQFDQILQAQLINNKIYFIDYQGQSIKWIDFEGGIYSLDFTRVSNIKNRIYNFLISNDGKRIVWSETIHKLDTNNTESKLFTSILDGTDKRIVLEKDFNDYRFIKSVQWSEANKDEVYLSDQRSGLGGYIIFDGPHNLYKMNINTREIKEIFESNGIVKDYSYIGDISSDEQKIVYFKNITLGNEEGDPKLIIKDFKTNKEIVIDIPIQEGFRGGGNAYFSPNGKYLIYNIAHWDSQDEYFQTLIIDTDGRNLITLVKDKDRQYNIRQWISNNKILLTDYNQFYSINIMHNRLEKIILDTKK